VEIDLRTEAAALEPVGHARPWGPYVAREVQEIALRAFADRTLRASVTWITLHSCRQVGPVPPQNCGTSRPAPSSVGRYEKFEIAFELSALCESL